MTNYNSVHNIINLDFLISEIKFTIPEMPPIENVKSFVEFYSSSLGTFKINETAGWYINQYEGSDESFFINILSNDYNKVKILIYLVEKVMDNFEFIKQKSRLDALNQLTNCNNKEMLYSDDTIEDLHNFAENMNIIGLCAYEDASIGIWYYLEEDEENARILLVKYDSYEVMQQLELSWNINVENYPI